MHKSARFYWWVSVILLALGVSVIAYKVFFFPSLCYNNYYPRVLNGGNYAAKVFSSLLNKSSINHNFFLQKQSIQEKENVVYVYHENHV